MDLLRKSKEREREKKRKEKKGKETFLPVSLLLQHPSWKTVIPSFFEHCYPQFCHTLSTALGAASWSLSET